MAELINLTPKWEYMSESPVSMDRMNELGAEGWEMIWYNAFFDQKECAMKTIAIFKRVRYEQLETIIPPHIPMPEPQVKPERDFDKEPYTMDEVVRRLSPHGDRAGEWYCTSRQRRIAWRIDMVDAEGLIVRKMVHDMREHTISKAPETCKPETVEQLAKKIIDYNFRFLADFDFKEWE